MKDSEIAALARGMVPFVRDAVIEATAPLAARLVEIEARPIAKIEPGPQGDIGPPGPPGPPGEPGEIGKSVVPPELAAEVAGAVRLLHESPPVVQRSEPAPVPPKLTRIERDVQGNFVPVYDGALPS